jgi:hypothetical protein
MTHTAAPPHREKAHPLLITDPSQLLHISTTTKIIHRVIARVIARVPHLTKAPVNNYRSYLQRNSL